MSLVEQALAKMRTAQEATAQAERRAAPIGRLQEPPPPPAAEGQDHAAPASSGRRIEIDRAQLSAVGLMAPQDQQRRLADEYRHIKRPLLDDSRSLQEQGHAGHNLIMVTSAFSGEGKSFTTVNLVMSLSLEKDRSVLLVDADVIKPQLSRLFGVEDQPGLLDLLRDPVTDLQSAIIDTDIPGLQILPAGRRDDHATELLASRRMKELAHQLSSRNPSRVVVFDSPPILQTAEAKVLASLVGQVVMVVAAGETPQAAVLEAIASLGAEARARMLLNKTQRSALDYYQYGRGYGYGYYDPAAGHPGAG